MEVVILGIGFSLFIGVAVMLILIEIGERGGNLAFKRNNPSLAVLLMLLLAMVAGECAWVLFVDSLADYLEILFNPTYPLIILYWASWLFIGAMIGIIRLMKASRL